MAEYARRDWRRRLPLIALAVGLLVVVILLARHFMTGAAEPAPAQPAPRLPAGEFQPTTGQWANLTIVPARSGSFDPALFTDGQIATDDNRTTQMFSPFSGRIARIFVQPGDQVRQGSPVYSIAASELVQGRSDVATAEASLAGAQKALAVAEANAARQQALFRVEGAAARDVQQSQSDLAAARSTLQADQAQLAAARSRLSILGLNAGSVTSGQGDEAVVRSPIAGTVITRQAGLGQYLESAAAGAGTALFTISDLSQVWLVGNIREADAGKLRRGQLLEVSVPAYPDRVFEGHVYFVSPTVDPNTRRIAVRAQIRNPDGLLRPNMFATARLFTGHPDAAVEVPADAVLYEEKDAHVWVAHPERHSLSLRQVRTGAVENGYVTIIAGLNPGERVVSAGSVFIDQASTAS